MNDKNITITKKSVSVNMGGGEMQVTIDALEALKLVGYAYGLYNSYEDKQNYRVMYQNEPSPTLVVQKDVSLDGNHYWNPVGVLTEDPQLIERYLEFRHMLGTIRQMELEAQRSAPNNKRCTQNNAKRMNDHER